MITEVSNQMHKGDRVIEIMKRADIERERDQVRSIEINMMRELMRRYPEQARDVVVDLFKLSLTKSAA